MRADLRGVLDAFDLALAAAASLVPATELDPIATTVRSVRDRAGYLGETVVAAVAGGTGSGKSSLINSLAGEEVAPAGGMRPTTATPLAWIPANPEPGLVRLLDDLGIEERVGQDLHPWLALVDLPDTDSVVADHRHTVASILPRVDLVIWVIDPEKYQDRLLHEGYLRRLAAYHRQFVFVVNQIDRLDAGVLEPLVKDLETTLRADGIPGPRMVTVAADPPIGPPIGIDELVSVLEETVAVKGIVYDKLATDLATSAATLSSLPELSGAVGFEERWRIVKVAAAERIASGDKQSAQGHLTQMLEELSDEVGGEVASEINALTAGVANVVDTAYEASGAYRDPPTPPPPGWVRPVRAAAILVAVLAGLWMVDSVRRDGGLLGAGILVALSATIWTLAGLWSASARTRKLARAIEEHRQALAEPIERQLDAHLGRPLRQALRRRARATAAATELSLALVELERRLGG